MKLSIVTTMFKSETTIAEFVHRTLATAGQITDDFEIVIIDDGSPDNSLAIAKELAEQDRRLKIVELSRNFGHHKALMTGLRYASGDFCLLIDSDLEEPPETLGVFWDKLGTDVDVIYGYQESRRGNLAHRFAGWVAYRVFNLLIPGGIPTNHLTIRLMRRDYVDALLLHGESQVVIGGLWVITGFRQKGLPVGRNVQDKTTYSYWRRWKMFVDSVTNFSEAPLIGIFYLGIAIAAMSILVSAWLILRWLISGVAVAGWLSVMMSVWFLGGIGVFCIGVIGIYLGKVFTETKNRPYTIVRKVHQAGGAQGSRS